MAGSTAAEEVMRKEDIRAVHAFGADFFRRGPLQRDREVSVQILGCVVEGCGAWSAVVIKMCVEPWL